MIEVRLRDHNGRTFNKVMMPAVPRVNEDVIIQCYSVKVWKVEWVVTKSETFVALYLNTEGHPLFESVTHEVCYDTTS